jgi:hybrid cluster-associated redox disulfide protein
VGAQPNPAAGPLYRMKGVPGLSHFTKEMTVDEAFRVHAGARRVFARFHLGGCSHCAISEHETIEQVSEGYGIPLPMLLEELEKLYEQGGLSVGDRVRIPDTIREKIPQLKDVPEFGEVRSHETGAYTVDFGEVRLQGLAEDFIKVEPAAAPT